MADDHVQHRFPPHVLREYAILADGLRAAVCGPRGEIVWMCAPLWHDDAVFSALLGGPGAYAVHPAEPFVWGGHYEPRSLIWRNRWITTAGIVECREALAHPATADRLVLLRRIEAEHPCTLNVHLDVRPAFGAERMTALRRDERGNWTARAGRFALRWRGAPEATVDPRGALSATISVAGGGTHDLVLEVSAASALGPPPDPEALWRATHASWEEHVPELGGVVAPRDAQHAVAVLRGMTAPTGGMAAAATMSLPERAEQGRNYDYRYSWIRDQCYAAMAAAAVGNTRLLDAAVEFVTTRVLADGPRLRPAYTVDGGNVPDEQHLSLPGYPGGQTVVAGNRGTHQFQLDTFGEVLQVVAAAAHHGRLDADGWRAARVAKRCIEQKWDEPEAGLWELHPEWWAHSRLACAAGLRNAARHAPTDAEGDRFDDLAAALVRETTRRCLHPSGFWRRCPSTEDVGAELVLPPVRGAVADSDTRTKATVEAVRRRLVQDSYVYRFPQDPHELGTTEGAFLLCGFMMTLAELDQGDPVAAFRYFERNRAACGPPGLFAEEYDVQQRQLRGNLPQAFVHAMLLECARRLHTDAGGAAR